MDLKEELILLCDDCDDYKWVKKVPQWPDDNESITQMKHCVITSSSEQLQ